MFNDIHENKLLLSIVIILTILLIRWLLIQHLSTKQKNDEDKTHVKRWQNYINKISSLILILSLIIVWISEIRYFAISIAAFIVSFVIATREFIQCYIGSLYLTSTRLFNVGDWIKVGNLCGEVIDTDWISTRVLEVNVTDSTYAFTGKVLSIPNNQFVNNTVENLSFMRHYVSHSFSLVRDDEGFCILNTKDILLPKAREYCAEFREVAERYSQLMEKRLGVSFCALDPSLQLSTTTLGKNQFTFSIFCPRDQVSILEQKITEDFLHYWHEACAEHEANKEAKKPDKLATITASESESNNQE